ncbi:unnamed protein product, partial [Didymodactylos carnosus]
MGLTRVK